MRYNRRFNEGVDDENIVERMRRSILGYAMTWKDQTYPEDVRRYLRKLYPDATEKEIHQAMYESRKLNKRLVSEGYLEDYEDEMEDRELENERLYRRFSRNSRSYIPVDKAAKRPASIRKPKAIKEDVEYSWVIDGFEEGNPMPYPYREAYKTEYEALDNAIALVEEYPEMCVGVRKSESVTIRDFEAPYKYCVATEENKKVAMREFGGKFISVEG